MSTAYFLSLVITCYEDGGCASDYTKYIIYLLIKDDPDKYLAKYMDL